MARQTIADIDVASKRVLMRVDFNVPLDDGGSITDDRRIVMALGSIENVISRGGRLVLMSHLGRPGGTGIEPALSLAPVAARLGELLEGTTVHFVNDLPGSDAAHEAAIGLSDGDILLLENLRFDAGEKAGDGQFGTQLGKLGEIYCNDAFGTAHRKDASMVAAPASMSDAPKVAGLLLEKELTYLNDAIEHAQRPFVAVLGGAKVSDKLGAIEHLRTKVDTIIVGGAMAYTFLAAQGLDVGASLVEPDCIELAEKMLADENGAAILLPDDHVCAQEIDSSAEVKICGPGIDGGWMGLDIGPESYSRYVQTLRQARTIVWNGPMGVFETPPFDVGTRRVAQAIVEATEIGAISIVGGGDSAAAVGRFGLAEQVSHVSTGGGASLKMLEGVRFEAVDLLDEA